ncbi:MAG: helix-turn-helix transcriptional regulator [Acidobacteriota bacterium]
MEPVQDVLYSLKAAGGFGFKHHWKLALVGFWFKPQLSISGFTLTYTVKPEYHSLMPDATTTSHAGDQLRAYRSLRRLRLKDLAKDLGCSVANVSGIERGDHLPSLRLAFLIEEVTDGVVPASAWKDLALETLPKDEAA